MKSLLISLAAVVLAGTVQSGRSEAAETDSQAGISTSILVRVQSRGGKFLGPDIGYSMVTVRDSSTGELLAKGIAAGDSGQVAAAYTAGASPEPIITWQSGQPPVVRWLVPTVVKDGPSPTAAFLASFRLMRPTLVEITARGMTGGLTNQHVTSATMWISPGQMLTEGPGLVLIMPGLDVAIGQPAAISAGALQIQARVRMMCGCKIGPGGPWPPTEFTVTASLASLTGPWRKEIPLAYASESSFAASIPLPPPGVYLVTVTAVQPLLNNAGVDSTVVTIAAPATK